MSKRTFGATVALIGLVVGTAACSGGAAGPASGTSASAPAIGVGDPPVTLRLAVADSDDRPSAKVVGTFVERVTALSRGNVTIEPTFDAGNDTSAGYEVGVAELLRDGKAELAITASRAWDLVGVTSLMALQAPFLIDTDALALAVAKSDIATRALDGMAPVGISGLAMWPEDLRHLYSFPDCDKDFRTPEGIAGAEIAIIPSRVSRDVIKALGGIDSAFETGGGDAEACRLHGVERGSSGLGVPLGSAVSTGNVVLSPKYQTMAANKDAFERLSDGQQAVIRQAALEAQTEAFTEQPDEAALAAAWCKGGGTVQLASADQVAALKAATAPVTTSLEQDPLTKQLIADIETLKTSVTEPVSEATCEPPVATGPAPSSSPQDLTGFLATTIPDGTYRTDVTEADLLAKGASAEFAAGNAGVKTWTFSGGTFNQEHGGTCSGTYEVVEGSHLAFKGCDVDGAWLLWRPEGDGIVLMAMLGDDLTVKDRTEIGAYFDRIMTKID